MLCTWNLSQMQTKSDKVFLINQSMLYPCFNFLCSLIYLIENLLLSFSFAAPIWISSLFPFRPSLVHASQEDASRGCQQYAWPSSRMERTKFGANSQIPLRIRTKYAISKCPKHNSEIDRTLDQAEIHVFLFI